MFGLKTSFAVFAVFILLMQASLVSSVIIQDGSGGTTTKIDTSTIYPKCSSPNICIKYNCPSGYTRVQAICTMADSVCCNPPKTTTIKTCSSWGESCNKIPCSPNLVCCSDQKYHYSCPKGTTKIETTIATTTPTSITTTIPPCTSPNRCVKYSCPSGYAQISSQTCTIIDSVCCKPVSGTQTAECSYDNCFDCVTSGSCGWCKSSGNCVSGSSTGSTDQSCQGSNWAWTTQQCAAITTTITTNVSTSVAVTSSFLAGTEILTPFGYISIENLQKGDEVISYDHTGNKIIKSRVKEIFERESQSHLNLKLSDGTVLYVTEKHPFFDGSSYKPIKDFKVGDYVYALDGNQISRIQIESVELVNEKTVVYNIHTVANNYFANGILVHNKNPASPTQSGTASCLQGNKEREVIIFNSGYHPTRANILVEDIYIIRLCVGQSGDTLKAATERVFRGQEAALEVSQSNTETVITDLISLEGVLGSGISGRCDERRLGLLESIKILGLLESIPRMFGLGPDAFACFGQPNIFVVNS